MKSPYMQMQEVGTKGEAKGEVEEDPKDVEEITEEETKEGRTEIS